MTVHFAGELCLGKDLSAQEACTRKRDRLPNDSVSPARLTFESSVSEVDHVVVAALYDFVVEIQRAKTGTDELF